MTVRAWHHEAHSETVSWSKIGFVCYATPECDTHNLKLTFLENTDGTSWRLAAPHALSVRPSDAGPLPEIHVVKWSNLSTDLAVFDHLGNFYILLAGVGMLRKEAAEGAAHARAGAHGGRETPGAGARETAAAGGAPGVARDGDGRGRAAGPSYELTSYNHTEMIFRDVLVRDEERARACVAFTWLGIAKPSLVNKPARLDDDGGYSYGVQSQQAPTAAHPIQTKQACVALRQDGCLTLYYQGEHKVEYHKLAVMLRPAEGFYHISHASIGSLAGNSLLVTVFDTVSNKVVSYSVTIDWGFLTESAIKQRTDPHFHTPPDLQTPPSLQVALLHEMAPAPQMVHDADASDAARLISIDMVTVPHEPSPRINILLSYETSGGYTVQRYEMKDVVGNLRPPFCSSPGDRSAPLYVLSFQDRISVGNRLKAVRKLLSDSVLLLAHQDGTFVAVNIETWSVIEESEGEVNSLLDVGYTFPQLDVAEPFVFCVSPNMTAVVYKTLGADEPLKLALLESKRPPNTRLASVGFSCIHAHACYTNNCSDDLLALITAQCAQLADDDKIQLLKDTITSSHAALNFRVNSFAKESVDKLLSNPPLQKLLSLQLVLSDLSQNNVSSSLAWVVLNLRSTSFGIMFTLSSIYRQVAKKKPVEDTLQESTNRAECITSLVGNIQWIIDLMVYFNQELFQLSLGTGPVTFDNCIVLPVILSKVPRFFLMYALSSIGKTCEILKKLFKDLGESNKLFSPMKESLNRFFNVCKSSPLEISSFEAFLRDCETALAKEPVSSDRMHMLKMEQQLFCHGSIPREYHGAAKNIVDRHAATFNRETKLSDIYFYDSSWLHVGPLYATPHRPAPAPDMSVVRLNFSARDSVDALRKVLFECPPYVKSGSGPMGQAFEFSGKVRKCVRCRSVSSVSDPLVYDSAHPVGLWTMVFQRTCICGSVWINCT